jgi:hypothetical protein
MNEQMLRIVAAVAAIGIFSYPFVLPAFGKIKSLVARSTEEDPVRAKMRDIETVLALSSRLAERGVKDGVELCQKLIDAILKPQK